MPPLDQSTQTTIDVYEYDVYWETYVDPNNILVITPFMKNRYNGSEIKYNTDTVDLFLDRLQNATNYIVVKYEDNTYIINYIAVLELINQYNCEYVNLDNNIIPCDKESKLYEACMLSYQELKPYILVY
jgi:hypothetical protein